jgi:hypothetical protein
MRRRALAVALVAVAVSLMTASVAWGDPAPLCNGQPSCSTGWYTSPVTVSWSLGGGTNAGGCATQMYAQDTNQTTLQNEPVADLPPWTYCITNVSGGTDTRFFFVKVELSSPTATATPSRPPDSNGWYNHPVAGTVSATSFSGIASCTSTTFSGPSTTSATVAGTCFDNAGKSVTVASAPFAYDTTPPTLTATADPGDRSVALSWQAGADVAPIASVAVTRTGGTQAASADIVYSGDGSGFEDTHVRNGVHYTYTVTARDAAGNVATQTIAATPGPRLLGPAPNAHVNAPPMLSWTAVRGATYYNVQLFRADPRKVLSLWPANASLQLKRTWRFEGRRYRLKPGRYRWYVWPGFGKRKAGRYGHVIGSGTFVVVR